MLWEKFLKKYVLLILQQTIFLKNEKKNFEDRPRKNGPIVDEGLKRLLILYFTLSFGFLFNRFLDFKKKLSYCWTCGPAHLVGQTTKQKPIRLKSKIDLENLTSNFLSWKTKRYISVGWG